MKALLICPADRQGVAALAESAPFCNLPALGKSLVEYWLEHLLQVGSHRPYPRQRQAGPSSRPCRQRREVGTLHRSASGNPGTDRRRSADQVSCRENHSEWLAAPNDAQVMDHLPGMPDKPLLDSYADWVAALEAWMPRAVTQERLGVHELRPGIWAGMHVHVSPTAELRAPCWLGDHVYVGNESIVGPMGVLENAAFVEGHSEISHSVIGPETFVGKFTEVGHSIAWGSTLVDWKLDSCIKVPDAFLLCSLGRRSSDFDLLRFLGRVAAFLLAILFTFPFALYAVIKAKIRQRPALRAMIALRPQPRPTRPGCRAII